MELTLPMPRLQTSDLQHCESIDVCCLELLLNCGFPSAAPESARNTYHLLLLVEMSCGCAGAEFGEDQRNRGLIKGI